MMSKPDKNSFTPKPRLEGTLNEPLNREPPVEELISRFLTEDIAYDRNHGPIPHIDSTTHRVRVEGVIEKPLSLTVSELATSFPQHEVVCALQCAGNRRHTMRTWMKDVDGIDWGDGAVMNCFWQGPRLRDVLLAAGIKADTTKGHVAFACLQTETQNDSWYGGSIELSRAISEEGEVILALERNSKPLSANHGAPVRVIAPGIAGARSVKWLDCITIQEMESDNFYQKRDYKILPEHVTNKNEAESYWKSTPAIHCLPVNSVIVSPRSGSRVTADSDGMVEISGYALPQGDDGPIVRVEVSTNKEQKEWTEATLQGKQSKWSWALWKARLQIEKGNEKRIFSRAIDKAGNEQVSAPTWNLRGVAYNGYGESRNLTVV